MLYFKFVKNSFGNFLLTFYFFQFSFQTNAFSRILVILLILTDGWPTQPFQPCSRSFPRSILPSSYFQAQSWSFKSQWFFCLFVCTYPKRKTLSKRVFTNKQRKTTELKEHNKVMSADKKQLLWMHEYNDLRNKKNDLHAFVWTSFRNVNVSWRNICICSLTEWNLYLIF